MKTLAILYTCVDQLNTVQQGFLPGFFVLMNLKVKSIQCYVLYYNKLNAPEKILIKLFRFYEFGK